jgi:hypothetical protein
MPYQLEINEEERQLLLLSINHAAQTMSSQFLVATANERREALLGAYFALSKRLEALTEAPERDLSEEFLDIGVLVDTPHRHLSLVGEDDSPEQGESGSWMLPNNALVIRAVNPDLAAYGIHVGDLILVDTARNRLEGDGLYILRGSPTARWELLHWLHHHGEPMLERGGHYGPAPRQGVEVLGRVVWVLRRPSRPQAAARPQAATPPPPTRSAEAPARERMRAAALPERVTCARCGETFAPTRADIARVVEAELAGDPAVLLCPNCQEALRAVAAPAARPSGRRRRLQAVEGSDGS